MSVAPTDAGTQTSFRSEQKNNNVEIQSCVAKSQQNSSGDVVTSPPAPSPSDRQATLASMLNNFIDNLAARLPPERNQNNTAGTINDEIKAAAETSKCSASNVQISETSSTVSNVQIRRTSDLLDTLQRALMCPPSQSNSMLPLSKTATTSNVYEQLDIDDDEQSVEQQQINNQHEPVDATLDFTHQKQQLSVEFDNNKSPLAAAATPHFPVLIEIENALHISKIFIRINKKFGKQRGGSANSVGGISTGCITSRCSSSSNNNKSAPQQTTVYRGVTEIEPSAYVTFEATGPPTSVVQSHEGPVYTTNVVEKSCNPQWNKRFEVFLPVDLITCVSTQFFRLFSMNFEYNIFFLG